MRFPVRLWREAKVTLVCGPVVVALWYGSNVFARVAVSPAMPSGVGFTAFILCGLTVAVAVVGGLALAGFVIVSLWDRFDMNRSFFRFYDWVSSDD